MPDKIYENEFNLVKSMMHDGMMQPVVFEKIKHCFPAEFMKRLVSMWSQSVMLGSLHDEYEAGHMMAADEAEKSATQKRNQKIAALVSLAAEVTQATFDEIKYRGWQVDLPVHGEDRDTGPGVDDK